MLAPFLAALSVTGLGAPYPHATITGPVEYRRCDMRYRFTTGDPIESVAVFYRSQASKAGVPLLDDSASKFADYRTLVFVGRPRFLNVVLGRRNNVTKAIVDFHTSIPPGCG